MINEVNKVNEIEVEVVEAVNLTPHKLRIEADDGVIIEIPPSGMVARCATEEEPVKVIRIRGFEDHPITVSRTTFGTPFGVPEAEEGKIFLTSTLVREATKREDTFAPGKGIRNDLGQVTAAKGFACS